MKNKKQKTKYEYKVKPFLKEIEQWAEMLTEQDIAKKLNITRQSFSTYKKEHKELRDALTGGQKKLVVKLRSALIQKALGYEYTEKKTIKQEGQSDKIEIYQKHMPADTGAVHLLLKNYDRDNWCDDWNRKELREKELEIKTKLMENQINGW